jgi:predicted phage-related endonuclease
MAITECEEIDVAALIGNNDLRLFTIKRDKELEELVIGHAKSFWNDHVITKIPPPASSVTDAQILYPIEVPNNCIEADPVILESLSNFIEKSNHLKTLSTECDRLKTEILSYMGQSEKLTHSGKTLATWKSSKSSQRLDVKALGSAHPEIASQFMQTVVGSRRFLVKGIS